MTMIDEQELTEALTGAANDFNVSDAAARRILEAANVDVPLRRTPTFFHQTRSRNILVAAALVLVVGAISLPLIRDGGGISNGTKGIVHAASGVARSNSGVGLANSSGAHVSANSTSGVTGLTAIVPHSGTSASIVGPKIESNGSVHLTVGQGQVDPALTKLSDLATGDGGYVLSSHANAASSGSGRFSSATIVLQVPQHHFATLVTQVQRDGHATSIDSTSTNVTSQFVDLHARISALEVSRHQYLSIMTRASTIGGILAVQNQLDSIQSQIEQLQGQMNMLNNTTTYGTLTVQLTAAGQMSHQTSHRSGIASAWHDSIGGFVSGFEWLIRIAGPALFVGLVLGALFVIGRLAWRATRRRQM
jgi:hypothetical protein